MQQTPRDVLGRYRRAILDKNADALADLYADDAVHEIPFRFPGMPARYEGREQVRAAYRAIWGASPVRPEEIRDVVTHETADPEVIVAEQVVAGLVPATGDSFAVPGVLVLRVRDGLITHVRDYMDALAATQALDRTA
ncbi:nuclear transport factor 2 family protein [Microbispora sp. RL4-1S]|uniref:Nuclear transport factor 2 family protein n=1 Tax=Microbispora oryzae TaxID=2806554 RepID=A0A941AS54_9ACTN|nr:nuclear transport factor 2 family protein [Microbispora oryzae]MBP2707414.1 nuclear transport factor 2 family protein [Microbispora oryzae]